MMENNMMENNMRKTTDEWPVPTDKAPSWDDAVECGCEDEWLDMYNSQNDG